MFLWTVLLNLPSSNSEKTERRAGSDAPPAPAPPEIRSLSRA
jgi:hypothetical protein